MTFSRFLWPLATTFYLVVSVRREPINPDQGWILVRGYRSLYGSDSGNFFYNQDSPQFMGHFWDLCVTVVDLVLGSFVSLEFFPALILGVCVLGINFAFRPDDVVPGLNTIDWTSASLVFLLIVQDGGVSARPEVLVALANVLLWRGVLTNSPLRGLALTTVVLALATAQSGLVLVPLFVYSLWKHRMGRNHFLLLANQFTAICFLLIPIRELMRGYQGYSRSHSLAFSPSAEFERYASLFDFPSMRPLGLVIFVPLVSIAFILEPTDRAKSIGFLLAAQPLMLLGTGSKWHWHLFALAPSLAICIKSRVLLTGYRRVYAGAIALLLGFFLANHYSSIPAWAVSSLSHAFFTNPIRLQNTIMFDCFVLLVSFLMIAVLIKAAGNDRLPCFEKMINSRYLTSLLAVPVAWLAMSLYFNYEYLNWQRALSACALVVCALIASKTYGRSLRNGVVRSNWKTLTLFSVALSLLLSEQLVSSQDQSRNVEIRGRAEATCVAFLGSEVQLEGSDLDSPSASLSSLIELGHVVATPQVVSAYPCFAALFANVQSHRSPIVAIGSNHPTGWELGLLSGLIDVAGSGQWTSNHCENELCVWVAN